MYIWMAVAVVVVSAAAVWKINQWKQKNSLVIKNGSVETVIPIQDIIEVLEMNVHTKKEPTWLQTLLTKKRIAIFTRSNVSYYVFMRNPNRTIKKIKASNPHVFIKAKAV